MRDLAALTEEARPEALQEWLQLDLDEEPLMPLTYHMRPKKQQPSVYILDEDQYKWHINTMYGKHHDTPKVPNKGSALEELLG